jgi:uncharacterized lipoprotein YmbA
MKAVRFALRLIRPAIPAVSLALAGCGTGFLPPPQADPTRYFVLSSPALPDVAGHPEGAHLHLGLRPIDLPEYLHGRPMAIRDGSNELVVNDFYRWAEPLSSGIERVLRLELAADPAVAEVMMAPFPVSTQPDFVVSVSIVHCEGTAGAGGSHARFSAVYQIATPGPDSIVYARRTFSAPDASWDGRDFGKLAALLSADVSALARDIESALPTPKPQG